MKNIFRKVPVVLAVSVILTAGLLSAVSRFSEHAYAVTENRDYGTSNECITNEDIDAAFPASYAEKLKVLHQLHPQWKFRAFYTGLDWEACFQHNADYTSNTEMYVSRNLIEYDTMPESWYSTEVTGSFNWKTNSYTVMSAPNWIQVSEEALRYMMDPRNWLDEEQIFQFMDQTAGSSLEAVKQVFNQVSTDYWRRSGEESGLYWEEEVPYEEDMEAAPAGDIDSAKETAQAGSGSASESRTIIVRHYLTYAEALVKIGAEIGVNPVALATRVVNEQGIGSSPLISGTRAFTLADGSTVDGGYYNYFNMEATDGGDANMDLIITNGLREAYNSGWSTRFLALYGGAVKYAEKYIYRGQSNIYLQKYNVDSRSTSLFWKQYMQAVMAPVVAARANYRSYRDTGILEDAITFLIPVFNGMPDVPQSKPEKDGNPNNRLYSVHVDNEPVPDFDIDTVNTGITVSTETVHVLITACAGTSVIEAGGTSGTGLLSLDLTLETGDNPLTVVCTAENGDRMTYCINIHREQEIIYGDVNYDKQTDSVDQAYITAALLGQDVLDDDMKEASDINGDGTVTTADLSYLSAYLLNMIDAVPQRAAVK